MATDPSDPALPALAALAALGIPFDRYDHPPVHTVDEALVHWAGIHATHCKNLFLRNKKGTRHYLVVARHDQPVSMANVATIVGDDRLSFASPERLQRYLGLVPGSVSPLGLIHDITREVHVVVETTLRDAAFVGFHPNTNTATIVISGGDFQRFLASTGHDVRWATL